MTINSSNLIEKLKVTTGLDLSQVQKHFGIFGKATIEKIGESLKKYNLLRHTSLDLSYDEKSRIFSILNSSTFLKSEIDTIFEENNYGAYYPNIT